MNIFYYAVVTFCSQGIGNQAVKGFFLGIGIQRNTFTAEHLLDEGLLKLGRVFRIVEHAVDIRETIIEGREEETLDRLIHDPVLGAVFYTVFLLIVSQARLGQMHGTDTA